MQKVKYYKCPHCGVKYQSLQTWGNHVSIKHPDLIPEGWSYGRYFYYIQTGKKAGSCIICKNPTEWHESTLKYERFCTNPKCKEQYRESFKNRMMDKYGKVHLLDDPEQQRKMLASKHISGQYTFLDGGKVTYTGTYELDFLKFMDKFLHFKSSDIMIPSPHTYYYDYKNPNDTEHEGRHFYIPDAFIPSLSLEIEIKQNTNMHPKLLAIDKVKELQKDEMMKSQPGINYFKIVEKNYAGFLDYLGEKIQEMPDSIATEGQNTYSDTYIPDRSKKEKLSSFTTKEITPILVKEYIRAYKPFENVELSTDSYGELFLDSFKVVGHYNTIKQDGTVWLQDINVATKYRKRGLASQILNKAIRKAKVTNVAIDPENKIMLHVLLKAGFVDYGKEGKKLLFCKQ